MKTRIIDLGQIQTVLPSTDLIPVIEAGFVAYSDGLAVVPPVGELTFEDPPGDAHIKYGYIVGEVGHMGTRRDTMWGTISCPLAAEWDM